MKIIKILLFCFIICACGRIRNKKEQMIDKFFPHFDSYQADTKFNKKRFQEFLKVPMTKDVKNIYCFGDMMGIDAKFQFSFDCNDSTKKLILQKHQLTLDTNKNKLLISQDFDWWKQTKIDSFPVYSWNENEQYYKYFWYDSIYQKAYYLDFDR